MSEPTPGPWEWVAYHDDQRYLAASQRVDNSPIWDCAVLAADGAEGDLYIRIRQEDARLIAASPDLLAACEFALECLVDWDRENGEAGDMLRAAIAKAKGTP